MTAPKVLLAVHVAPETKRDLETLARHVDHSSDGKVSLSGYVRGLLEDALFEQKGLLQPLVRIALFPGETAPGPVRTIHSRPLKPGDAAGTTLWNVWLDDLDTLRACPNVGTVEGCTGLREIGTDREFLDFCSTCGATWDRPCRCLRPPKSE